MEEVWLPELATLLDRTPAAELAARYVSGYLETTPPAGAAADGRRGRLARVGVGVHRHRLARRRPTNDHLADAS